MMIITYNHTVHDDNINITSPYQFPLKNQVILVQMFCSFYGTTIPPKHVQMDNFWFFRDLSLKLLQLKFLIL